ncbi:FAD:protein FMN transferase, partial [Candidatus Aerophobetes bacterium]|nr:FAD:protein FMN transferase [Candidatus Aerophobetes bacterium]
QNPRKMGEIIEVIEVKDMAVATSGDYRRYYMIWGKRFGHIINPATGWTVQDNPMSVTIVCSNVTDADALATGVFVLGPEKGMELIESLPDVEGMIISEDMKIIKSGGWGKFEVN